MFNTLRFKLIIIFGLLIILSIITIDTIIIKSYEKSKIKSEEVRLFTFANIISGMYKSNNQGNIYLKLQVKEYSKNIKSRIMIMDKTGTVFTDSYGEYTGRKFDCVEFNSALKGNPLANVYSLRDKPVIQLASPIEEFTGLKYEVSGAVIISSSLVNAYKEINSLKWIIAWVSIAVVFMGIIVIILVSHTISKPIRQLTKASARVGKGSYGEVVDIKRKDEIGNLIDTFNEMSRTLNIVESNRKKFISDVSHELKTPLASMKTLAESVVLYDNNDLETYKDCLKDINSEVDRLTNLVKSLLTAVRFGEEKFVMKKESLKSIAGEVVKLMAPYAEKNEVVLSEDGQNNFFVECDRDKIKEVLINLIDNAIKYADSRKPSKLVEAAVETENMEFKLRIKDNGRGIAQDQIPFIFENFYRVDKARMGKVKGFGIGLSIVKQILDRHGWSISVESELGQGSVFIIKGKIS